MPEYKFNPVIGSYYCDECGGSVYNLGKHDEFHEKMDELIDWAKDVSKLFDPNAAEQEHFNKIKEALRSNYNSGIEDEVENSRANRPKGKMLGPNPGLLMGEINEGT